MTELTWVVALWLLSSSQVVQLSAYETVGQCEIAKKHLVKTTSYPRTAFACLSQPNTFLYGEAK